jgi:hypothetical protein
VCFAVALMLAIGCGSPPVSSHTPTPPTAPIGGLLGSLGTPGCNPAATFSNNGMPETGINSNRGSLWALFFIPVPPSAGEDVKVVWRMTGAGVFVFRVSDAAGKTIPLLWGPEPHEGSTWVRPGDEVGTGFNFPHAGCWQIHVDRSDASGDLWLAVISSR